MTLSDRDETILNERRDRELGASPRERPASITVNGKVVIRGTRRRIAGKPHNPPRGSDPVP
jgi:hypothetical protein